MQSEYFKAKVVRVSTEPKVTSSIQRCGFLWLTKVKTTITVDEHFIFVNMEGTDFLLKIKTDENVIKQARVDADLSVHLEFRYEFSCFHFLKKEDKEKIIKVERRTGW